MSYDALMRWEWEGGASACETERERSAHTEPAENTPIWAQTASRRKPARSSGACLSYGLAEGRRRDGSEG